VKYPKPPKVVRHRSARSIVAAFFKKAGGKPEDWLAAPDLTVLDAIKAQGQWAFCDGPRKTIHWWVLPRVHPGRRFWMLAHELGHYVDAVKMPRESEARAEWFAWVADQAMRISRITSPSSTALRRQHSSRVRTQAAPR
jgi:hypothetical protein